VALLLLVVMIGGLLTKTATAGQHVNNAGAYLLAVAMAAPYAMHRRLPLVSLAIVLTALLVYAAIGFAAFPGINAFVLLFGIALHSDRARSAIAFLATATTLLVAAALQPDGVVDRSSGVSIALATVVAWLGGENVRQRRARWAALRERNALLEREREERARQAVMAERLSIARELHDVVAHAMSVIAVQSGVGNHVIDTQPAEAKRALAAIETTSRSVLTEMRHLLGVLRQEGDASAATDPARSLRDVPALIEQAAGGGLSATLQIEGTPIEIPSGLDLSAYRIVQEALTNAIKHGGPRAAVTVSYRDAEIGLEVISDASVYQDVGPVAVTPGHGLIGMRERVAAFGGVFSASPRPGGGFRVAARLPLDRVSS
jgi:signal transduction histidine kinase